MSLAKDIKQSFLTLRAHRTHHKLNNNNYATIRANTISSIAEVLYRNNLSVPRIALSPKTAHELQQALDSLKNMSPISSREGDCYFFRLIKSFLFFIKPSFTNP